MFGVNFSTQRLDIDSAYKLMQERFAQIEQAQNTSLEGKKSSVLPLSKTGKNAAKTAASGAAKSHAARNAAKAVQSGGFFSKLKSIGRFLMGEWAGDVGKAYHDAKKLNVNTNIRNFAWGKAYAEHFEKAAVENAKAVANNANKGFFKKGLSFLGRKMGLIFNAIFFGPKIVSALKNDGIVEALKETVRAAAGLTAFALGGVVVGMFGFTGISALFASLLVSGVFSMLSDKGVDMALGKSKADEREEIAKQQAQLGNQAAPQQAQTGNVRQQNFNPVAFERNNPELAYLYKRVYANEPVNPNSIYYGNAAGGRVQYYA